jgi:tetrahydromethanopterin S-methyltransferase subunit C
MDAIFKIGLPIAGGIGAVALFVYNAFFSKEEERVRALACLASLGIVCWACARLVLRLHIVHFNTPASRWAVFHSGTVAGGIGAGLIFALLILGHLRKKRQTQHPPVN